MNEHTAGGEQWCAPLCIPHTNLCGNSDQVGNFVISEPSPEQGIFRKKKKKE